MGLKLLHSADWHLDSPFSSFPEEQRSFLRAEQKQLPGKIGEICRREGCDLVLLAGDLFDGSPSRETVEGLKLALAEWGVPVFIAPGNHDFCCLGSPWLEETWPENVHIFTGSMESVSIPQLDCRVYGAGYRSMDCPGLLQAFQPEGTESHCIMVLHGDPVVKNSPCCPVTAAQVRNSGLDYLALGHIHKAGAFRAGDTLCAWPGCPMGRGWDETGEKGVCIVTLGDCVQLQTVKLDVPMFHTMEVDVEEAPQLVLDRLLPGAGNLDFYRITLTGCGDVDCDSLRTKFNRFPNLEFRDNTQPPIELWADVGEDTLRGVYFRLLQETAQTDPRATLAAQISRKLLSGKEVKLP